MADFGAPVAAGIAPPTSGLDTLSAILGLKQKQLGLTQAAITIQQQQQQLKQQTAEATVAAIKSQQTQNLSQVKWDQFQKPDGSYDMAGAEAAALRVAPNLGPEFVTRLGAMTQQGTAAKQAMFDLNQEYQRPLRAIYGTWAGNPDSKVTDLASQLEAYQDTLPASAQGNVRSIINSTLGMLSGPNVLTGAPRTLQEQKAAALAFTRAGLEPSEVGGVGGLATPAPGTLDTGTQIIPTGTNRETAVTTPNGPAVAQKQIPPQIVTPPGGVPQPFPGGNGAGPIKPSGMSGPAPTNQDWQDFGVYAHNLNARVAIASDSIPRIEQAEKALSEIHSGAGAEGYSKLARIAQAAGLPQSIVDSVGNGNLGAAQEAEKYLFQTTFSGLRQAMQGDPARVAEFQSAEQVFPSIGTDPRAAKAVLNFMVDQGKRDYAEQQALVKARKDGSFNPATWQAQYQEELRAGKVPGVPESQVPREGPKEGVTSKSRSGKPIVFRNGRWEYQ